MGIADKWGPTLMSGVLANYGPRLLKGAMAEYLGQISFQDLVQWVNQDKSLWAALSPGMQRTFMEYGPKLGKMEWFTVPWVIEAARTARPSLCSLFIGWPEGQEWLQRQLTEIKNNIGVGESVVGE